jgi:hypothetical protein
MSSDSLIDSIMALADGTQRTEPKYDIGDATHNTDSPYRCAVHAMTPDEAREGAGHECGICGGISTPQMAEEEARELEHDEQVKHTKLTITLEFHQMLLIQLLLQRHIATHNKDLPGTMRVSFAIAEGFSQGHFTEHGLRDAEAQIDALLLPFVPKDEEV